MSELAESIRYSKTSQKQAQNNCASSVAMLVVAVVMCIDIGWKCIVANFLVDFWMMSAVSAVAVNFVVILALLAIGIYGLDLCSDQQMTLPKGQSSARSQTFTKTGTYVNNLKGTSSHLVPQMSISNS